MSEIIDDKSPYVIPFIIEQLESFQNSRLSPTTPFFIGLNGVQGAGKSVLVSIIKNLLQNPPYNLHTVVFSLDDLYLTHEDQLILAKQHPDNPLLQHRGQPSTHDIPLAIETFESLKQGKPTKIPQYNKAAFSGKGDRAPESEWETVNTDPSKLAQVVLFEGWCVGFRPLDESTLRQTHSEAVTAAQAPGSTYQGRLGFNTLQSVTDVNESLKRYDAITDQLDAFVHIDAEDPQYVYRWRLQQEEGLRLKKGSGMTDEEVRIFVDGYYPAYELYTKTLRRGVFHPRSGSDDHGGESWKGRQLELIVGVDRKVKSVVRI